LRVYGTYVHTIITLWHAFEVVTTKKEATFEEALNAKNKVLHLKNGLRHVQTQAWKDAFMIQALELAKSNFTRMQSRLDKSLAKNEEYQTQLPTL